MPLLFDSLFSSVAFSHLIVDVFNSSRPVLLTYLGLTETQIALISTIYIWASALTQPFFGWISDRVGPRWLAAGGVLWMTVFFSGAVLIPGAGGLLCLIIAALAPRHFIRSAPSRPPCKDGITWQAARRQPPHFSSWQASWVILWGRSLRA